jgi:acyl-CoA hydrolase
MQWGKKVVSPEAVLRKIRPGMGIFIGTGAAEPRRMVGCLMNSKAGNLRDLELIQIVSFGEALNATTLKSLEYRLKTFCPASIAEGAIMEGHVDLIPCRLSQIAELIESPHIPIDAAFVQVTPPDAAGNCSLGVAVDAARQAMERASVVVGEINPLVPHTYGDTFVHVSDFDFWLKPIRRLFTSSATLWTSVHDQIGKNVADLVADGSCLAFYAGPFFEALGRHLSPKRHLGIHSPFLTDALMDLIQSGAVTNRKKETYRGKSLVSYALGTPELLKWLDKNPLVEFQGIDKVLSPAADRPQSAFHCLGSGRADRLVRSYHPARRSGKCRPRTAGGFRPVQRGRHF